MQNDGENVNEYELPEFGVGIAALKNPYAPGAGHEPPYLAGRAQETDDFRRLLGQERITENMALTGLRGMGKTVLLKSRLKEEAVARKWIWVEGNFSESSSVGEDLLAKRLITDLSVVTSGWKYDTLLSPGIGFSPSSAKGSIALDHALMWKQYQESPGLAIDKLKGVLELLWNVMQQDGQWRGIVYAYDEAQHLTDKREADQYPLSVLLDAFSSLQSRGVPFLLLLCGLPALLVKLVEARAYAERMFHVVALKNLSEEETREAIVRPLDDDVKMSAYFNDLSPTLHGITRGYPHFVQYWCQEWFERCRIKFPAAGEVDSVKEQIRNKLDQNFFEGRWGQLTDRERDLLKDAAQLDLKGDGEFSLRDLVDSSNSKPFSSSNASQILARLTNKGMVLKNRHGKYSLAVPMLDEFIRRQILGTQPTK